MNSWSFERPRASTVLLALGLPLAGVNILGFMLLIDIARAAEAGEGINPIAAGAGLLSALGVFILIFLGARFLEGGAGWSDEDVITHVGPLVDEARQRQQEAGSDES